MLRSLILAAALSLAAVTSSFADDPKPPRTVSVSGTAEVRVEPDEVVLTLGVETMKPKMDEAKKDNDSRMKAVIAAARDIGIESKDIRTDFVQVEPRYRDSYEQRDFIGYNVRQTLVVTLRDVPKFELLMEKVLLAGANHIMGVEFKTSKARQHRDTARRDAMKAAKEKAELLAGELDQAVGQPLAINEANFYWSNPYSGWWGARGGQMMQNSIASAGDSAMDGGGSFMPGQLGVTATVNVTFELEAKKD